MKCISEMYITLFDGNVTTIHHRDENSLSQWVFERKQFVLGHRSWTRPQDSLSKQFETQKIRKNTMKHLSFSLWIVDIVYYLHYVKKIDRA